MIETQLDRPSLRDQALSVLRQRLVTGILEPGSIYSVNVLARELGVSNSPVREAMLELQNQGLVVAVRNRGFCVVELSDRERANILDVRIMLEVPSMERLAGDDRFLRDLGRFRGIAGEIIETARAGDVLSFLDADRRFHLGLIALLDNEQLVDVVGNLRDRTRLFADKEAVLRSAEEHVELLDVMAAGDVAGTRRAMTAHLEHVLRDWRGTLPSR